MARRFERSGELLLCYGCSEAPATEKRENNLHRRLGIWLAVLVFAVGMLFFAPHALGSPAGSHAQGVRECAFGR